MAKTIQFKRGTTAQVNAFVGALGEVVVDTDKDVIVVHDGVTAGGFPAAARANTDGSVSILSKTGSSLAEIPSTGLFNNTLTATNTDQALTAAQGKVLQDTKLDIAAALGVGQTYSDVTASRTKNVTYTNTTGRAILVNVCATCTDGDGGLTVTVGGIRVGYSSGQQSNGSGSWRNTTTFIVPNFESYVVSGNSGILFWVELT